MSLRPAACAYAWQAQVASSGAAPLEGAAHGAGLSGSTIEGVEAGLAAAGLGGGSCETAEPGTAGP